jgi:hypothetical protein
MKIKFVRQYLMRNSRIKFNQYPMSVLASKTYERTGRHDLNVLECSVHVCKEVEICRNEEGK